MQLLRSLCLAVSISTTVVTAFILPTPSSTATTSITSARKTTSFSLPATAAPAVNPHTVATLETFILPMGDDSRLKIRFQKETFKELALKVNALLASFRVIKAANAAEDRKGPPPREPSLEFVTKDFNTHLEMECNPNIYPDAFHATVFVKVNNEVMEVSSQCQLSALVDSLKIYKQTYDVTMDAK